jgi:predicted nuclease with TOPRIM domain
LSIDYLAGAVTGDDALSIGTQQTALGRAGLQQPKRRTRMQETKSKLKNIIEEVISEQDAPEAIEKAVESDAGLEELLAAMAERMGELENEIQRLKSEYSNASARMGRITGEQE